MRMQRRRGSRKGADALSLAQRIWAALDTPKSLALWIAAKYRDHKAIVGLKDIDPLTYDCPVAFFMDYQACKLLAKSVELKTGIDKRQVASRKFIEAEVECSQTNEFFRLRSAGVLTMTPSVERVFTNARALAAEILGSVPSVEELNLGFGPGASFGVRGDTSVFKKVTSDLECTYAMVPLLPTLVSSVPGWLDPGCFGSLDDESGVTDKDHRNVELIRGSELTFVPKDATTDRAICIEPLLNGFVQKGIGRWIAKRLKKFGVDLSDQTINQHLAQKAWSCGLSTIDLSSASDTIAFNLVLEFLPMEWFELLDAVRSPSYEADGRWYTFQKFSSMGNAYTFELESLIFYCLAKASCKEVGISYSTQGNLHVFGDDIIIPRPAFDLLTQVLHACGFSVNKTKSFKDGPFYESCGADYFRGLPVRPIFLKERIDRKPLRRLYATNSIRRIQARLESVQHALTRRGVDASCRDVFLRLGDVHHWMVTKLPPELRVYGPEGKGDGHLIAEFDEALPRFDPSWEGWNYISFREVPCRVNLDGVTPGYALYFGSEPVTVVTRDRKGDKPYRSVSPALAEISDQTLDPGRGYDLRGRSKVVRGLSFCASRWTGWRTIFNYEGTTLLSHDDEVSQLT